MDFERLECHFEPNDIIYFRSIEELIEIRNRLRRNCEESNFEVYATNRYRISSYGLSFYEDEMLRVNGNGGAICRNILRSGFGGTIPRVFFPHNTGTWFEGHCYILSPLLFVPEASFCGKDGCSIFDSSEYKSLFGQG